MTMRAVCDGRIEDLLTHVPELADAIVHRYASWSLEQMQAGPGERHLGVWPTQDPLESKPFITGSPAGDYEVRRYAIVVWEDASTETSRLADDEAKDGAWLDLVELIEGRLRVQSNIATGETGGQTVVGSVGWGIRAQTRWLEVRFTVSVPVQWS